MHRPAIIARSGLAVALAALIALTGCATAPSVTVPVPDAVSAAPSAAASSAVASTPAAPASAVKAEAASKATSLKGKVIVIDPGHTGGWTKAWGYKKVPNGAGGKKSCNSSGTATKAGYSEHAYNFAQAKALAAQLTARGATVKLTRSNDTTHSDKLCINHRADLANSLKADVFISIHADGNTGKTHRGYHIIRSTVMKGGSAIEAKSAKLAKAIRAAMDAGTSMPRSNYIGKGTALNPRSDLGTLNFSRRPAVLIEMGNMFNAKDAAMLTSSSYRTKFAVALASGIAAYLG